MPRDSRWYLAEAQKRMRQRAAKQLLAVAVYFVREHAIRLNVSNPGIRVKRKRGKGSYTVYATPSRPGEYPRARTGALKRGQRYDPTTVAAVIANGLKIRCGMLPNVFYGAVLELKMGRLGLRKTLADLKPQLQAIVRRTP